MKSKLNTLLSAGLLLLTFLFANRAAAQIDLPTDKVSFKFRVEQKGCEATIICDVQIVNGWHVNSANPPKGAFGIPTTIVLSPAATFKAMGNVIEPKPHFKHDDLADEDLYFHEGKFTLKRKITVLSATDFMLKGTFGFQTCNDDMCLPPYDEPFSLKIKGCADAAMNNAGAAEDTATIAGTPDETIAQPTAGDKAAENATTAQPETKKPADKEDHSLLMIFLLSFLSGLAALLTPCVFPMIPMTVSFFTKQSKTKAQGIRNAVIYGISIIAIYIILGTVVTAAFGAEVLNEMSTNPWFNIIFFLILVIFAVSFLGAFEIRMPSSWVNKADRASDRGGLIGIFFMALALALVSFSCTGPIVGTLLVQAAAEGGVAPFVGMFGFSLALALPFGLFAAFPGWMNTLPKSGGWLNAVKVVLGFLELALALKFLSNADLAVQAHYLERELFLAIWIGIFTVLALYLFGVIRLPHDSPLERLSVGRTLLGTTVVIFVIYMIPGMWGAPLKIISAFPPPLNYSEAPLGFGGSGNGGGHTAEVVPGTHLGPQNIMVFHDFDEAQAHAKKVGKPLFIDFTGHNCVNCRRMEQSVWGEPGIIDLLKNDVVIASLHVDERIPLPESEQIEVELTPGRKKVLRTTGDKWMYKQIKDYKVTAQPYYIMLGPNGENLANGSADYEHHSNPEDFKNWLDKGLKLYGDAQ